ncbi:MAG: purine-nucleoside phosphorylase [Clostridia bacterium]|nr:purine-nucleoside phosphorylase [Clostridia bacterium]
MSVELTMKKIHRAAKMLRERCGEAEIGVILGSGLGDYVNALDDATSVSYEGIPGFPISTAPGHEGRWYCGTLHGKRVCMMQGRFHSYEGYGMDEVTLPIRVMKLLGVKTLIVTNAAGGVNYDFTPGDLMLIDDFINLSGKNPLTGPNLGDFGLRFPDMTHAYDVELKKLAMDVAAELKIDLKRGVYCWLNGPTYETPAEIRMTRILGADAVGMSTVPETIVARHCGINVLGISCITNMAAGMLDQPLSHIEVMETGIRVRDVFRSLVDGIIAKL